MTAKRIFLIHATPVAVEPIGEAFSRLWPEAQLSNLLDDSLSSDLGAAGGVTEALKQRFLALASYAVASGADGILFTCSAFGEAIDLCKERLSVPVLKPNEALIDDAVSRASRIAIVATFMPAITSIIQEFDLQASAAGRPIEFTSYACPEALQALREGDALHHDRLITELVSGIEPHDLICFAQFSMVSAAPGARAATGIEILTTPDSAVLKLRALLSA